VATLANHLTANGRLPLASRSSNRKVERGLVGIYKFVLWTQGLSHMLSESAAQSRAALVHRHHTCRDSALAASAYANSL
jgi:hypothetical protein